MFHLEAYLRFMGLHQWHVQAGHSQLWLNPWPAVVGRATILMKGTYDGKWSGKSSGWREENNLSPLSSPQTKTADSRCQVSEPHPGGFQATPTNTIAAFFVCQLTSQMPMSTPSWVCMMPRASSYTPTTTWRRFINSFALQPFLHNCNLLYCKASSVSTVVHWLVGPCSGSEIASLPSCFVHCFYMPLVCCLSALPNPPPSFPPPFA